MRLIDADAFEEKLKSYLGGTPIGFLLVGALKNEKTIDAVPVVRCGQCRYERPEVDAYTQETVGYWCSLHDIGSVQDSDFCSYGERKEGAD